VDAGLGTPVNDPLSMQFLHRGVVLSMWTKGLHLCPFGNIVISRSSKLEALIEEINQS
jgi:hypothetical protein